MRLVQIRNKAAPSEIIPEVSIQRIKLIVNQLGVRVVYITSLLPSEITINRFFPLNYNTGISDGQYGQWNKVIAQWVLTPADSG
jgi:hypothetical protein